MKRVLAVAVLVVLMASPALAEPLLSEPFEDPAWHDSWVDWRASDDANTQLVDGYRATGLAVQIPPGVRRGTGPRYRFPEPPDELWFRYHLRLDSWQAATAGKLPGPDGVYGSSGQGCIPSTPADPGWSARMMFAATGTQGAGPGQVRIGYYTYHLDQPGDCGEWMLWNPGVLDQDRWYCIQGHVALNDPGEHNGSLRGAIDGTTVFQRSDLAFRRTEEQSIAVRSFWLDVYFGGSTIANTRNLGLRVDEVAVSDSGPVDCLTRFTDDDGNPHEADIEYLFSQGVVAGCSQNLFCPSDLLLRDQTIVLLDRILEPSPVTTDAFHDDDGTWGEASINRLAPLEIVRGCAPGSVCPGEPVTRGQMAAFLRRAFSIPVPAVDYFRDDDRSVFNADGNALAAAGITQGCNAAHDRFCPYRPLRRDEAASLLARAIQWADTGVPPVTPISPPAFRPQAVVAPQEVQADGDMWPG